MKVFAAADASWPVERALGNLELVNERVIVSTLLGEIADLQAIYVFGSMARGDSHRTSDVDVAILAQRPLANLERWELQEKLAALIHCNVDLVDLRSASTVFRVQVIADSKLLYEGDAFARASFEATALSAYARLQEERRAILADIQATGRVYG